jgi:hypothetical protein
MNIFFLSGNPRRCARWHCDKHVVKMILEYTQILYTANHVNGGTTLILECAPLCMSTQNRGYKLHAKNHPSVLWASESLVHYMWLCKLAISLVEEYKFRYNATHSCLEHLQWLFTNPPPALMFKRDWMRDPPPAMPDEYKVSSDSIECYRAYYNGSKRYLLKYTKRHVPHVFA